MPTLKMVFEVYRNDNHIQSINESFDCVTVETWADDGSLDQDWFWDTYGSELRDRHPEFTDCDFDILDWNLS